MHFAPGGFPESLHHSEQMANRNQTTPPSSDARSDTQLIAAIDRGDASAFDTLYYRHRDWIVRLAHRFTGNADDALDVMQETFTYLLGKFPGLRLSARMTTFLYPVVKNLSIRIAQERRRTADSRNTPDVTAPSEVDPEAQRSEMAAVMASLPDAQREVMLMRFADDMSIDEIGLALNIPPGTVKSRLHHAIATLRANPRIVQYFEK